MFTDVLWEEWLAIELKNYSLIAGKKKYLKKGYSHFDDRYWLPQEQNALKQFLQDHLKERNKVTGKMQWYGFIPFLKMLIKTPRYRYQEDAGHYDLECKIRPICFAAHFDSLIFGFYSFGLNKQYHNYITQNKFEECVLAYRSDTGKCNIQYSKDVFDHVKHFNKKFGGCTVIALDIKGYFDNINHSVLKEKWSKVLGNRLPDDQFKLFEALTSYSYVNKTSIYKKYRINEKELKKKKTFPSNLFEFVPGKTIQQKYDQLKRDRLIADNRVSVQNPNPKGIPQGSAMSALLSNIYLIDYDLTMTALSVEGGFIYRRYCDDIILICQTARSNELKDFAIREIQEKYHLTIQKEKAEVVDFMPNLKGVIRSFRRKKINPNIPISPTVKSERALYKNLQYLGFEFNGVTTFIRTSSLSKYFRKMKARLDKTVKMAYGSSGKGDKIFRFQIYEKYSHLGTQNFISYGNRAAKKRYQNKEKEWKEGHDSPAIRKQLARHTQIINESLAIKNKRRYMQKINKGKNIELKKT